MTGPAPASPAGIRRLAGQSPHQAHAAVRQPVPGGGCVLLGLTYGLVAASLPAKGVVSGSPPLTRLQFAKYCTGKGPASRTPAPAASPTGKR